eukprot:CAMPEP_0117685962 /NCGR_PEP_ID=MMETSP0804-20121206/22121_1 /TAXON_ID=1074897 /ORGANISM="Tetraselmis astigmatica, Strain CCMP880" /LENGTH=808 /DNA_ID=CAMNT_0005497473 /DNA_START=224 /DNA_END=2648 /DNA_ORIENTATION=-
MKIWQATVLLLVMLLADLLSSFGLAYVGVVHYSWLKHHPLWRHTVTETALDVAALSAVRSVAVMLLVCLGGTTLRGTKTWATELLQAALRWLFGACQLLLASKAVAVAMYGGLDSGRSGLTEGHSLPAYLASTAVPGAPLSELSLTMSPSPLAASCVDQPLRNGATSSDVHDPANVVGDECLRPSCQPPKEERSDEDVPVGRCELEQLIDDVPGGMGGFFSSSLACWGKEELLPSRACGSLWLHAYASLPGLEQLFCGLLWRAVRTSCQQVYAASSQTDSESAASGLCEPLVANRDPQAREGSNSSFPQQASDDEKKPPMPARNIINQLLKFTAPDWYILVTAFFFGGLAAWTQALIPYYIGRIVDVTARGSISQGLVQLVEQLLLVSAGCAVFSGLRGSTFTLEYAFLNQRIRSTLFQCLMEQDIAFYDKGRTGDVISRLSADVQSVSDSICLNSNVLSRSALQAGVVLYFMFTESEESWRLSVMTFVLVPIVLAICKVYGGYYRQLQTNIQSRLAEANSVAEEMVGSMTTVKAHAAEQFANDAYAAKLAEVAGLQKKQAAVYLVFVIIQTFLPNAMSGLVLYFGGSLIAQGKMDSGGLVSFMLYQQSLSAAFQAMGDVFSNLSGAVGAAEKVVEILQKKPEIPPCKGMTPDSFLGELELRSVVFAYPTRPTHLVLNGFNLTVKQGEVVALVGPSGGGKSSVVKLMQRFYLPITGQVLYDGRDVGEYDPAWLRKKVAMVGQEPVLYASSIYDNIVFGLPQDSVLSQQEVEEAAKLANAHSFISELPNGYQTTCGDKGVQLSGGQKQR